MQDDMNVWMWSTRNPFVGAPVGVLFPLCLTACLMKRHRIRAWRVQGMGQRPDRSTGTGARKVRRHCLPTLILLELGMLCGSGICFSTAFVKRHAFSCALVSWCLLLLSTRGAASEPSRSCHNSLISQLLKCKKAC